MAEITMWQAAVLGTVQGLGEFLPISSTAHLALVPWIMGWRDPGLAFDVALHLGTLAAVLGFFWRDWVVLLRDGLAGRRTLEGRLFWYLVLATAPGAAFGYLLEDLAATAFRAPWLIALMLMVMGLVLFLVDARARHRKDLAGLSALDALLVGLAQAVAVVPGVSRSGATITAARALGCTREAAARFSFLLSTPIIAGAGFLEATRLGPGSVDAAFAVGVATSAVVGFLAIGFLLRYVATRSFNLFVWYRFLLGAAVLLLWLLRG